MARRRYWNTKPKPPTAKERRAFADTAATALGVLAQNVVTASVSMPHSLEAITSALWPAEVVNALRRAYPVTRDLDRGDWVGKLPTDQFSLPPGAVAELTVETSTARMLSPAGGMLLDVASQSDPVSLAVVKAITTAHATAKTFGEIKNTVVILENMVDNGRFSLANVRHYAPWITQFLTGDHPMLEKPGREPTDYTLPMSMRQSLQAAPDVLLSASFAPQSRDRTGTVSITFPEHMPTHFALK
jgi:hypothetical protein